MIRILAVILIMVVVNLVMIFAIVKAAGRVEVTIRKYYIAKTGNEEKKANDQRSKDVLMFGAGSDQTAPETAAGGEAYEVTREVMRDVPVYAAAAGTPQNAVRYKNADFLEDYRTVRRMDMLDKKAALSTVIGIQNEADRKRLIYQEMLDLLDYDAAFRLSLRDPEEQESILREVFTPEMQVILNAYLAVTGKSLSAIDFYSFLNEQSTLFGDTFYVYEAEGSGKIASDSERIKTVEDPDITEGVKIIYQNKLYDYSI